MAGLATQLVCTEARIACSTRCKQRWDSSARMYFVRRQDELLHKVMDRLHQQLNMKQYVHPVLEGLVKM